MKLATYLKDAYAEMRKVTWPTQKQITTYSVIVILMSLGVALFFGILDYLFNVGLAFLI